jgi:hypothetical protein
MTNHTKNHENVDRYCFTLEIFDNKKQKIIYQYGYNTNSIDHITADIKDIIKDIESDKDKP